MSEHVHVVEEEMSFVEQCWNFLLNMILFLIIALVMGWFGHLIWNSIGIDPQLTWMNFFGLIVLLRFMGFAFNYDV